MVVVFTDLDGTLLDRETYSWEAARPAVERLRHLGVPCVLTTSKTRAEVDFWRGVLGNRDPFIVENGAAAFVPRKYFPFEVPGAVRCCEFDVLEWGAPYHELVRALEDSSRSSGCPVAGFHRMSAAEIGAACNLPLAQAALAKRREYDEPFRILEPARTDALLSGIEARGMHWTDGGAFHHICGRHDKGRAVRAVTHLFGQLYDHVITVGLGDSPSDLPFLECVDLPVVVRSRSAASLASLIPRATVTAHAGPRGWNEAILQLIERLGPVHR